MADDDCPRKVHDHAWHLDEPSWHDDPPARWRGLRASGPLAFSSRYRAAWFAGGYDVVREIASDPATFSSRQFLLRETPRPKESRPALPINLDPPALEPIRRLLLPGFSPPAMARLEPQIRATCEALVAKLATRSGCDAASEFAQPVPVAALAVILGTPVEDGDVFRGWIRTLLAAATTPVAELQRVHVEMDTFFRGLLEARRRTPSDDLTSHLAHAQLDGKPVPEDDLLNILRFLLAAGLDTTWNALGSSIWHLATHPADRRRLAAEPALLPTAIEEFLRAYAPVTVARIATRDVDFHGCPVKEGDQVLLSFPAANRDPARFDAPDHVQIDREENRHAAFGLGVHRCLGVHLARMELRVALEAWLAKIPEFELDPAHEVTWTHGQVRGPTRVVLRY